jgi:sensor histidine kinase YesM
MRMSGHVRNAALIITAWLPFFLFWMVAAIVFGHETAGVAAVRAFLTIGSAAVLGIAVSRYCGAVSWPRQLHISFLLRHLLAAAFYAVAWTLVVACADTFLSSASLVHFLASPVVAWQFVMGLWLYGVIAGISYAMAMQHDAHASEIRALQAESALAGARLQALQNRLQPHFLFNALHTIGALSRQDAAAAENAVEKLAEMLRYTLNDEDRKEVRLADEWKFTLRYLEFEKLRYEERLRFTADIDPAALECSTPSFALQTLVENAVRHSIAPRAEGGCIAIAATGDRKRLRIEVADDGNATISEPGLRYGLRTLRERLAVTYGDAAELEASRPSPHGYVVTLSLPWHELAESHDE